MRNRPNILIITADQMRADCLGAENPFIQTPNLDRMAGEGTLFSRAYCSSPVCTPSRASLLTGRYPGCTGAWNIGVAVNEAEITLADLARTNGYRTGLVGKAHFRPQCKPGFTREQEDISIRDRVRADGTFFGFETWHIAEDYSNGEYAEWLKANAPRFWPNQGCPDGTVGDIWTSEIDPAYHKTHWIAQRGLDFIHEQKEQPWLLWVSFVDPHHPFQAPRSYSDRYREGSACSDEALLSRIVRREGEIDGRPMHLRHQGARGYWPGGGEGHDKSPHELAEAMRQYYGMITQIDDQVGRLLGLLEEKGIADNTLVVFTSDHGELLGDHGLLYKGPWMYEGLVRVPMLWKGPGVPSGLRTEALMENVDVFPTLTDLAGISLPYGVQGVSQSPVLRGESDGVRESALISYDAHDRGIVVKSLRTDRYKFSLFAGESYGELYDLKKDPYELENRFTDPEYGSVYAMLAGTLCQRLMGESDPLPERKSLW